MAMTQMQIIQSLGESMTWLEKELNWDTPATELRHLIGRIGELYTALICNGQMAAHVNQAGYDVVSQYGERISVKTTAQNGASGHIAFNTKTLEHVDRVIIHRVNTDEMQIDTLFDGCIDEAKQLMTETSGKSVIALSKLMQKPRQERTAIKVRESHWADYVIIELENGTIEITQNNKQVIPVLPKLKEIAIELGISTLNSNGNPYNTRQLGSLLIKSLV